VLADGYEVVISSSQRPSSYAGDCSLLLLQPAASSSSSSHPVSSTAQQILASRVSLWHSAVRYVEQLNCDRLWTSFRPMDHTFVMTYVK